MDHSPFRLLTSSAASFRRPRRENSPRGIPNPHRKPSRSRKGLAVAGLVIFGLLFAGRLDLPAQTATTISKEYQVKAIFLFNFAQFVEWPAEAFPDTQTPLVIGVLGKDPFDAYLDEITRGEKANNRALVVQRYRRVEDIKTCHILFISQSEVDQLDQILAALKDRNILTVGDVEGFARRGVMIRFTREKSKTRLVINVEAAKAAGLTISSKLLRPAEIVTSGTK